MFHQVLGRLLAKAEDLCFIKGQNPPVPHEPFSICHNVTHISAAGCVRQSAIDVVPILPVQRSETGTLVVQDDEIRQLSGFQTAQLVFRAKGVVGFRRWVFENRGCSKEYRPHLQQPECVCPESESGLEGRSYPVHLL